MTEKELYSLIYWNTVIFLWAMSAGILSGCGTGRAIITTSQQIDSSPTPIPSREFDPTSEVTRIPTLTPTFVIRTKTPTVVKPTPEFTQTPGKTSTAQPLLEILVQTREHAIQNNLKTTFVPEGKMGWEQFNKASHNVFFGEYVADGKKLASGSAFTQIASGSEKFSLFVTSVHGQSVEKLKNVTLFELGTPKAFRLPIDKVIVDFASDVAIFRVPNSRLNSGTRERFIGQGIKVGDSQKMDSSDNILLVGSSNELLGQSGSKFANAIVQADVLNLSKAINNGGLEFYAPMTTDSGASGRIGLVVSSSGTLDAVLVQRDMISGVDLKKYFKQADPSKYYGRLSRPNLSTLVEQISY